MPLSLIPLPTLPRRIALIVTGCLVATAAQAADCPTGVPELRITSPAPGVVTREATVDVEGEISNVCALADLSCGDGAERVSVRARLVPGDPGRVWQFECAGVDLMLAGADAQLVNDIGVSAYGFDANGNSLTADDSVQVTHQGATTIGPPPASGGLPVNPDYTKSKVTWYHSYLNQDAFSTNARLGYGASQPVPMPCAAEDALTVTLFASGPSGASDVLYTTALGGDWNVCTNTKLRKTGPVGGIREILLERRSDGEDTFYVYWAGVEYGPSSFASVAAIDSYILQVTILSSGKEVSWQIPIGPDLTFEDISSGNGAEVRTVVRFNR